MRSREHRLAPVYISKVARPFFNLDPTIYFHRGRHIGIGNNNRGIRTNGSQVFRAAIGSTKIARSRRNNPTNFLLPEEYDLLSILAERKKTPCWVFQVRKLFDVITQEILMKGVFAETKLIKPYNVPILRLEFYRDYPIPPDIELVMEKMRYSMNEMFGMAAEQSIAHSKYEDPYILGRWSVPNEKLYVKAAQYADFKFYRKNRYLRLEVVFHNLVVKRSNQLLEEASICQYVDSIVKVILDAGGMARAILNKIHRDMEMQRYAADKFTIEQAIAASRGKDKDICRWNRKYEYFVDCLVKYGCYTPSRVHRDFQLSEHELRNLVAAKIVTQGKLKRISGTSLTENNYILSQHLRATNEMAPRHGWQIDDVYNQLTH